MALILSLETSASACSVALHNKGELIQTIDLNENQAHASKLALLIEEIFNGSAFTIKDLKAVAISSGPGSYTGLRIGTSTAKGICYALNIPLIAINTLDMLTTQLSDIKPEKEKTLFCPLIDAKRMEVYCQITDKDLEIIQAVEAKVIDSESFSELLKDNAMFFFGDGAAKCKDVIRHKNAVFVDGIIPKASALGKIAFKKFEGNKIEDLVTFAPFYLKDFMAKKAQSVF